MPGGDFADYQRLDISTITAHVCTEPFFAEPCEKRFARSIKDLKDVLAS